MTEEECYEHLGVSIVTQAINDWRSLCARRKQKVSNFSKLRSFFKSEYCQILCGRINSLDILEKLENEKIQIMNGRK